MFSDKRPGPHRSSPSLRMAAIGAALALVGLGLAATMAWVIYGATPDSNRMAFQLGIGGASLLSALSQIALLVGLWLMWRAFRRRPGA
jgi:hypothetical protein